MKNYNVNYVYNINSTFVDYDFAETGYFIDWDRSFSIEEEFMITSTNERKFLIGSYTATDTSKALNIEITDLNEFRVWMKNGKTDIKEGYVYPNEKVHLKYVWNATKSMWEASLTGNKTNINISGNLDMSGIDLYSLRIGNQDYRSDFTSEGIAFGSSAITIYGLEVNETYEKKESIRTLPVPNYIGHNFKNWLYDNEKVSSLNISNYKEHNIIFNAEYDFSIDASNLILYYDASQPGYRKNSKNQVKDLSGNEINGLYTGTLKVVDNYFNYEDSNYRDGIYIESGLKNLWKSNFTIITTIYFTCANNRDIILGNFNANNNMSIEKHPYNSFSNSSRIWWNNGEFGSFSNKEAYECNKINYLYYIFDKDNNLVTSITTDSSGYASTYLVYGTYTVRQVNSSFGYYKIDDFKVTIDREDDRPIFKLISDSKITGKVRVIKKDYDTNDNIINGKARFRIFDVNNKKYVSFKVSYPREEVIDTFDIDSHGTFMTPDVLEPGKYILYEVDTDMDGYLYNKEGISFTIGEDSDMIKENDDMVLELYFYNKRVKGTLNITKYGDNIKYNDDKYYYNNDILLNDVVFYLYAKEDIYENGKLIYSKDDKVNECTTNDGKCKIENIPLGNYYLKEISSSEGNVLDNTEYNISFSYKDQYTENIVYNLEVKNHLPKGKIVINKYETGTKNGISGTLIEIRNINAKSF